MKNLSSADYWERRYAGGGNSGSGSYGRLSVFKAQFINAFIELNNINSVIEFGCGDGNQTSLLSVPRYTGVDASPFILEKCRAKFQDKNYTFVSREELHDVPMADLSLSMDVVFHLVEDDVFEKYMREVFIFAVDYVIFYTSNFDGGWPAPHVRHHCITRYISETFPEWKLIAHVPNIYPFDIKAQEVTSFCDFFVFGRNSKECRLMVPAAIQ